jgi:hypothetical protein
VVPNSFSKVLMLSVAASTLLANVAGIAANDKAKVATFNLIISITLELL